MKAIGRSQASAEVISGRRSRTLTKALLVAGIVAVAIYPVGDLLSGLLYHGYSFKDQAISELSALGSPVRPLMLAFLTLYGLLGGAFGIGIWRSAGRSTSLRLVGSFLIAATIVGLVLHPVFPMTSRGMEATFTDTMHQILTAVWGLLVALAMVSAAVAYRGWFRFYSIGTLVVAIVFGALSATAMGGFPDQTSWAGGFERANAYAFNASLAVLAVTAGLGLRPHAAVDRNLVDRADHHAESEPSLRGADREAWADRGQVIWREQS